MSENAERRPAEEAASVDVGEPERATVEEERAEPRPDLDERDLRIPPERKPMGPPLEEPEEALEDLELEQADGEQVEPVDPA